jgi:hypothetical protein
VLWINYRMFLYLVWHRVQENVAKLKSRQQCNINIRFLCVFCTVCNTWRRIYSVYCFTHIPCFAVRTDNRHAVDFPKCYVISCVVYLCERPQRKEIKSLLKKQTLEMPSSCFWKLRFRSPFLFLWDVDFFTFSASSLQFSQEII